MTKNNQTVMLKNQVKSDKRAPLINKAVIMSWVLSFLTFSMASQLHAAALESIDYLSLPGDKTQVLFKFSGDIEEPDSFSIDDPARIVLDFDGVENNLGKKVEKINLGAAESVSAVYAGGKTRLVINLTQKAPYAIDVKPNLVSVTVASLSTKAKENNNKEVTAVDFKRGENGEARVIISLNQDGVSADISQEASNIVVDLLGAKIPVSLQRRLEVIDFATPVQYIDSSMSKSGAKFVLENKGKFEHLAYQSESAITIEVKPAKEEKVAGSRSDQFGYKGERLSLNFQNIEVRAVLQILADFTGMNLVTSDTVNGNLTLRLKNVPWDQALDIILKTKGLAMRQNGNVMLIAPAEEIAAREKQELEAQRQLVELEPIYSELIEINFAKAEDLALIIDPYADQRDRDLDEDENEGFLSPRGSVTVDQRTNALLIRDTAKQLREIRELIDQLDIPIRQVLIESRIVIANNDFAKDLGARFGVTHEANSGNGLISDAATSGSLSATTQYLNGQTIEFDDRMNVNLPVDNPAGQIALALAKLPFGTLIELELSAMQEEGKGEVISSPRVITSNQHTAVINQGTEIPYQEASSSGATTISFKEAVLKLEVTPQITPDDQIVMDLVVKKDEVGDIFLGVPSIDTRSVETQVLVDNGETVVLGGVFEQTTLNGSTRVPFFGDLPYVGFLFKQTTSSDRQKELLIFVTPKILKDSLKL
jgi:type IV pilus assembly protein PilQ